MLAAVTHMLRDITYSILANFQQSSRMVNSLAETDLTYTVAVNKEMYNYAQYETGCTRNTCEICLIFRQQHHELKIYLVVG